MQQGIELARSMAPAPDFFLFTDADIEHAPDSVATLVSIAEAGSYDLASFMVKLHCADAGGEAADPAFVYFFFKLYPPAWIANPRREPAGAAGGCILIRPAALEQAGGIQAIRQRLSTIAPWPQESSAVADACGWRFRRDQQHSSVRKLF